MGRIRTIKPSFFEHQELSLLPAEVHILAAGLLCYADDDGYFLAHPKLVQAAVFPIRELSGEIPEMLGRLQEIGYIRLGKNPSGKLYGQVINFSSHQKVSHPTPSKIKEMDISWDNSGEIPESSGKTPEPSNSSPDILRPEGKGKEEERKGREREEDRPPGNPTCQNDEAEAPEGMTSLQYARGLMDRCNIPHAFTTQQGVTSAIEAYAKEHKISLHRATDALIELARSALSRGEIVNKFWFLDGKYRGGKTNGFTANRSQARSDSITEAVAAVRAEVLGDNWAARGFGGSETVDDRQANPQGVLLPPNGVRPS